MWHPRVKKQNLCTCNSIVRRPKKYISTFFLSGDLQHVLKIYIVMLQLLYVCSVVDPCLNDLLAQTLMLVYILSHLGSILLIYCRCPFFKCFLIEFIIASRLVHSHCLQFSTPISSVKDISMYNSGTRKVYVRNNTPLTIA